MPEPSMFAAAPRPRLTLVAALLVFTAAAGVFLIVGAQRSSGAPVAGPAVAALPSPAAPAPLLPAPTAPQVPATPASSAGTAPPTTATTPAPTTTTGAPLPRRPVTPPPAAARPAAPDTGAQLKQVEGIADTSGWDWRKVHVQF